VVPKVVVPRTFEMVGAMECASCVGDRRKTAGTVTVDGELYLEDGLGAASAAQSTLKVARVKLACQS
jgi:hypothetical protein